MIFEKVTALKSSIETGAIAVQNHGILPVVDDLISQVDEILNLNGEQPQQAQPPVQEPMPLPAEDQSLEGVSNDEPLPQ